MKRKNTYQMHLIEECEVFVESGIAVSDFQIQDNVIMDMEEGSSWGALE